MNHAHAHSLPFRLGATSFVLPADYVPNVEWLGPQVDDVELLCMERPEVCGLPDQATVQRLAELAEAHALTWSVHLPLGLRLGCSDEAVRAADVASCARVVERMAALNPRAWVVHWEEEQGIRHCKDARNAWLQALAQSMEALLRRCPDPQTWCVETLHYPFALAEPLVAQLTMAVCVDVGPSLLAGEDPVLLLERHQARCRIIHLHGIRQGREHRDLGGMEAHTLQRILAAAGSEHAADPRVVTLEVFSRPDFEASLRVLEEAQAATMEGKKDRTTGRRDFPCSASPW